MILNYYNPNKDIRKLINLIIIFFIIIVSFVNKKLK